MNLFYVCFALFIFLSSPSSCLPKKVQQENGYCGINGYEAHCVLDIMEEHIEATAIVNHCHIPIDITFRVIYRYGNGSEQRWQYTFVSTNQNERVLIPGLALPPAPHALVYLYVRVPEPLFDLHNSSLVAIEASFIAVVADDMWEEAEFLNEVITVNTTRDCFTHETRADDPLLWILGGALFGLLLLGAATTGILWWYRKKKLALDELALVSSIETGLPGAQPYQIGTSDQRFNNNNDVKESIKPVLKPAIDPKGTDAATEASDKASGFRFNRLKEDPEERKEKIARKLNKAVVIGNPILVDKTSVLQTKFNRVAPTSPIKSKPLRNETAGDAFKNDYCVDETQDVSKPVKQRSFEQGKGSEETELKTHHWSTHPLENAEVKREESTCISEVGARPKDKPRRKFSHENKFNTEENDVV